MRPVKQNMKKTLKHPALDDCWKDKFRATAMKIGFSLNLTKPMLEFLCATADGVIWDRGLYIQQSGQSNPDSFIATGRSLEKRGLIRHKSCDDVKKSYLKPHVYGEWTNYALTPAGRAVVQLVKLAGIFVESDAAINKKSRSKA